MHKDTNTYIHNCLCIQYFLFSLGVGQNAVKLLPPPLYIGQPCTCMWATFIHNQLIGPGPVEPHSREFYLVRAKSHYLKWNKAQPVVSSIPSQGQVLTCSCECVKCKVQVKLSLHLVGLELVTCIQVCSMSQTYTKHVPIGSEPSRHLHTIHHF